MIMSIAMLAIALFELYCWDHFQNDFENCSQSETILFYSNSHQCEERFLFLLISVNTNVATVSVFFIIIVHGVNRHLGLLFELGI